MGLNVNDVIDNHMTETPVTIERDLTIADARQRMADQNVRHLPVVEDGRLVGIVSARDLMMLEALPGISPANTPVEIAMSANPVVCEKGTKITEAVISMEKAGVGAMPVMEGRRLIGIFTTVDALGLLRKALS